MNAATHAAEPYRVRSARAWLPASASGSCTMAMEPSSVSAAAMLMQNAKPGEHFMKIGIVGVSGFGGSELLRLCAGHPAFEIAYVGGDSSAGKTLGQLFPAMSGHACAKLV